MFIYSVRASTLKFFAIICVCLAVLIALSSLQGGAVVYASVNGESINYGGIKTEGDRIRFIEGFGIKVKETPTTEEEFSMPDNFDRILLGYNELQKSQGLDLSKYTRKKVTHYSYEVTNYDCEGKVYVNLLVYRSKIIACDISSADPSGFVLPLTSIDQEKLK